MPRLGGLQSSVDAKTIRARLEQLHLPLGDYAVHSSASLVLRGVLEEAGDVDVVCRGAAWGQALALVEAGSATLHEGGLDKQVRFGDDVELYDGWLGADVEQLIDEAELIGGLPCVRLTAVVAMKEQLNRAKDRVHLERIAAHLASAQLGRLADASS